MKRGIFLNSSTLCVGGCSNTEMEEHVVFNCSILSTAWKEIAR
jgi:hypothetical protein